MSGAKFTKILQISDSNTESVVSFSAVVSDPIWLIVDVTYKEITHCAYLTKEQALTLATKIQEIFNIRDDHLTELDMLSETIHHSPDE